MRWLLWCCCLSPEVLSATVLPPVSSTTVIHVTANVFSPPIWIAKKKGGGVVSLLGIVPDLPASIAWNSTDLTAMASESAVFIGTPQLDIHMGWLGRMGAMAVVLHHTSYAHGSTIKSMLDDADFTEVVTAAKHLGLFNQDFIHAHPSFFSGLMMERFMDESEVPKSAPWGRWMSAMAGAHGQSVTYPKISYQLKGSSDYLKDVMLNDSAGFRCLLDLSALVNREPDFFKQRGAAWAAGDLTEINKLGAQMVLSCSEALVPSDLAKKYGFGNYQQKLSEAWAAAIDTEINAHHRVFTIINVDSAGGYADYLSRLSQMGYVITRLGVGTQ